MTNTRILSTTITIAAVAGFVSHADASLIGTNLTATISHTGVAGGLVGAALVPHTYGGAPSLFNNGFFGTFVVASPAAAPGFSNAILVDFSLFNYSGFLGGNTGTITVTGLAEDVAPGSIAIFPGSVGAGISIATNVTNGATSFSASWSPELIFTADPSPDSMVVAWNSTVVPAPGAIALLGAAGLVSLRRRRKA